MLTRRNFARRCAWAAAALPAWTEAALAQRALPSEGWSANTIWLNANENPDGPPRSAVEAMTRVAPESWRYHYPEFRDIYTRIAASEQIGPEQVLVGAGSTEVLNLAVMAFTAPLGEAGSANSGDRSLIIAEPTFEVPGGMARAFGRRAIRVPLTDGWSADVKRMAEEADKAGGGLIYICNPNNPTSSLTPKQDIEWLVANLPRNTVLVIDEAYIHFLDGYEGQSAMAYIRQGKDVVVMRTFSKIYGMAGLRVGFACAKPDLIRQMQRYRNNVISIVSARAALAALAEAGTLIPQRRARLIRVRTGLCAWLKKQGLRYIEPHANFLMIETGRDARELGSALLRKDVAVGRPFPPLDNKMLRVSIGTERDMVRFKEAFLAVYSR